MMLKSVDLPHPEGPMIETNSPAAIANEMSSTAGITPSLVVNRLLMRFTSSTRVDPSLAATHGEGGVIGSAAVTFVADQDANRRLAPRGYLDQLRELLLAQRRGSVLERDRVLDDCLEPDDPVGIDGCLREEIVADPFGHVDRDADEFSIDSERSRIVRVEPVDRLPVSCHETIDDVLSVLQRSRVGDEESNGLPLESCRVVTRCDDPDLALVELLQSERRRRPSDVDIHAAGDDRLLRFPAALCPQHLKVETVLLEDAAALTHLGDRRVPIASLPGGDFELVLRKRNKGQHA